MPVRGGGGERGDVAAAEDGLEGQLDEDFDQGDEEGGDGVGRGR